MNNHNDRARARGIEAPAAAVTAAVTESGFGDEHFSSATATAESSSGSRQSSPPANTKPSNPKDALGILKIAASVLPQPVLWEASLGMLEGSLKYGRHNYRVIGVRGTVYFDAAFRHLSSWYEGEDLDPDSGLSHITKAITSLIVLRDAMIRGNWVDDRPPKTDPALLVELNKRVRALLEKYPEPVVPYTEVPLPPR